MTSQNEDVLPELVGFLEELAAKLRRHRVSRQEAARLIGYQLMDSRVTSARRRLPHLTSAATTHNPEGRS